MNHVRSAPTVTVHAGRGPSCVFVTRPDGTSAGRLSVDMLATLNVARTDRVAACFLRPSAVAHDPLLALTTSDVPRVSCVGLTGTWLRARWGLAAFLKRGERLLSDASASFWHEIYREVRRHAGDEQLPPALRARLRDLARRSFARSTVLGHGAVQYPRRLLRDRVDTALPPELLVEARHAAEALGIVADSPVVTIEPKTRSDVFSEARRFLAREGYTVIPVGGNSPQSATPLLDAFLLLISRFVICGSVELQQVAYLTNTPSLTLNASDAFTCYPVREDGLYTLKTVIDLDTGRVLTADDVLSATYFRNLRNCGYRDNSPAEILEAVREMHEGVSQGWHETESQTRFRQRVVDAGTTLASNVPHVAEWGPDRGFIGDGRLARFQADRAL